MYELELYFDDQGYIYQIGNISPDQLQSQKVYFEYLLDNSPKLRKAIAKDTYHFTKDTWYLNQSDMEF